MSGNNIKNSFDHAEKIAVVGSPSSSHSLTLDILGTAVDKKLVGALSMLNFQQDSKDNYALGQITEINLRNVWSEDPTMRGLIRQKGRVDPITERQDTHTATMLVSSVFGKNQAGFEPSMLGTVPSTGTPIRLVNEQFMRDLLSEYANQLIYMGKAYGSSVLLPMWLKHFGQGDGGIGEAYHIGIFGKTGSGKSVLAKMVMMGYAKNKPMSVFVLDPQGEFAKIKNDLEMAEILGKLGKAPKIYNLHNLVLTGNDLFKKILVLSRFFDKLGIFHEDNKARASDQIDMILQGRHLLFPGQPVKPWHFYKKETFDKIWSALADDRVLSNIYTSKDLQDRVRSAVQVANSEYIFKIWAGVANLFTYEGKENSVKIIDLTKKVTEQAQGQIVIIDLADVNVPPNTLWNDDISMIVINEFLESLNYEAQNVYKQGRLLNTLVIVDEAHRLAPRELQQNAELEKIRATLKDAVRTTRKFGLGWMFVSQTLSGLDRELINQMRIYFFGFGLSYGIELLGLREIIGGNDEAIRLYQLFKDPQSNPKQKEYSFMTIGPASPLSFSGLPLFFQVMQYPDEFIKENIEFFNK